VAPRRAEALRWHAQTSLVDSPKVLSSLRACLGDFSAKLPHQIEDGLKAHLRSYAHSLVATNAREITLAPG
jgi:hypothetical protein